MKNFKFAALAVLLLLVFACPAMADDKGAGTFYGNAVAAGVGAGLAIIGAGWGLGRIGSAALESMARQPEVANKVQTAMLIIAALLEGATFFALIICIIMAGNA